MAQTIIRPARLDDAEALQRNCYPDHSLDDVRDYLAWCLSEARKGRIVRLVAEVEGQAVGNAQLTVWGQDGEIGSLFVGQEFRRRGLAKQLLWDLVAEAKRKGLVTLEIRVSIDQPEILAFYQSLGFHPMQHEVEKGVQEELAHTPYREPIVRLSMQVADL